MENDDERGDSALYERSEELLKLSVRLHAESEQQSAKLIKLLNRGKQEHSKAMHLMGKINGKFNTSDAD